MKKIFIMACAVFLSFNSLIFSETSLDDVFYSIASRNVTSGDFVQEKEAPNLKRPLKSTGKFVFSKDGIVWQTLKPFPTTMSIVGSTLIQTNMKDEKMVTDGSSDETFKSIASAVSSLFSGNRNELEKHYDIKEFKSEGNEWNLSLTLKDKTIANAFSLIKLNGVADSKNSSISNITFFQNDNNVTKYQFLNQIYKNELSEEEKQFLQK